MKKRILVSFWLPPEVLAQVADDVEIIYPQEKVTGVFSMDELTKMLPDVDGVLISGEVFDRRVIEGALNGRLKVIGRHGVGCDSVDCEFAGKNGIAVVNTPISVTQPTAELSIAILMAVARSVVSLDKKLRRDGKCIGPPSYDGMSTGLYGKTLGIIGFGRIGKAVGKKAKGLDMNVIYSDVVAAPKEMEEEIGARRVTTEELLKAADFVSVHCPYLPENHHLINAKTLAMMKPGAYLVNASRGKMIDEAALVDALRNGTIKGAALDVYEFEPQITAELLAMDNVVMTPHVGTCCYDARKEMAVEALDGMTAFLKGGNPPNIFNREFLK